MSFIIKYECDYVNERSGCCSVQVRLKGTNSPLENYVFSGYAYCHPDDTFSELTGCRIAEMRAQRNAFKEILKYKREELHKLENFVKACGQYKNFDKDSSTARCMYRQLNRYKKEVEELKNFIKVSEKTEKEYLKFLDRFHESVKNKTKKD